MWPVAAQGILWSWRVVVSLRLISDVAFHFSFAVGQIEQNVYEEETYAVKEDLERPWFEWGIRRSGKTWVSRLSIKDCSGDTQMHKPTSVEKMEMKAIPVR